MQKKIWVEICTDIYVQEQKKNTKQMSWLQTRVEILKFESKKICESSSKKKTWVEKVRTLTSCVINQCLHFTETRLLSKVAVRWLPNIAKLFSPLTRIRRGLGKAGSFSVIWHFRITISATWRVEKHTCDSVVKISWDLWFFRKREVHPLYFKLDWNSPVQLSVAPVSIQ